MVCHKKKAYPNGRPALLNIAIQIQQKNKVTSTLKIELDPTYFLLILRFI